MSNQRIINAAGMAYPGTLRQMVTIIILCDYNCRGRTKDICFGGQDYRDCLHFEGRYIVVDAQGMHPSEVSWSFIIAAIKSKWASVLQDF